MHICTHKNLVRKKQDHCSDVFVYKKSFFGYITVSLAHSSHIQLNSGVRAHSHNHKYNGKTAAAAAAMATTTATTSKTKSAVRAQHKYLLQGLIISVLFNLPVTGADSVCASTATAFGFESTV